MLLYAGGFGNLGAGRPGKARRKAPEKCARAAGRNVIRSLHVDPAGERGALRSGRLPPHLSIPWALKNSLPNSSSTFPGT